MLPDHSSIDSGTIELVGNSLPDGLRRLESKSFCRNDSPMGVWTQRDCKEIFA